MLVNTVGSIAGAVGKRWFTFNTTCHFSTIFWLYADLYNGPLTNPDDYLDHFLNPTEILSSMLPSGRILSRPKSGYLELTPGNILIFTRDGITADHSCVAIKNDLIGGYNQVSWFRSILETDHIYSVHNTSEIHWLKSKNRTSIRKGIDYSTRPATYNLYSVEEGIAKETIRALVEK